VEDEEALETGALVSQLTDAVEYQVDDFLADGVVTTSVVIGSILLASDQLLRMEELTVSSSTDLIDYGWLEINEDGTWNVLSGSSLAKERVERVISTSDRLVTGHLTVRLDTVFQTVQLPAGIAHLDSGLADMYADALTHFVRLDFSNFQKENNSSV
jgi:hypothetical protein